MFPCMTDLTGGRRHEPPACFRGGDRMFPYFVPWWVALIALFVGGIIGLFLSALMVANGRSDPRE